MGERDNGAAHAVEADLAFHRALLAATHNELLERMEMVIESGLAHRDRIVHSAPHSEDPVPAHRAVLDAVRDRDPGAAEAAMRALLAQAGRDLDRVGRRSDCRLRAKAPVPVKITRIETFLVPPRWLFCRVETDEGVVGWGEPVVEGRAEAVRAAVDVLAEYLVGQDPLRIEDHWQVLTKGGFYRGGPVLSSAVAGLDQALWDIAGQGVRRARARPARRPGARPRPGLRLGRRRRTRPSSPSRSPPRSRPGFTAVKMNAAGPTLTGRPPPPRPPRSSPRVAAAREALGPDRDVAVDFHGRVTAGGRPPRPAELAPLHPLFVEEPVVPEHGHLLAGLVAASPDPARHRRTALRARRVPARARRRASRSSSPTSPTPAASPRCAASPRSPRPTAPSWPRTARSARSRSRPASRSPSPPRTS